MQLHQEWETSRGRDLAHGPGSMSRTVAPRGASTFALRPVAVASLRRPPLPTDLVERPRLLGTLDQGLERPATLISAPAGYGKSTLVSHWLQARGPLHGWVSLGGVSEGLLPFFAHLVATLGAAFEPGPKRCRQLLSDVERPDPASLGVALLNDLEELREEFVLVLDGMEMLRDLPSLELLGDLLRFPSSRLHLVLVGRKDPFLPLASLRASGQLVEIRSGDLRFSPEETLTLLRHSRHPDPRLEVATAWADATEGWITGLKLAFGDDGGLPPQGLAVPALTRHVREYLQYEVLNRLPEHMRRFLAQVSLPDRLCEPLCDLLRPEPGDTAGVLDGAGLEWLQGQGLFLIPMDGEGRWFRLHRLVRQFLRVQMERQTGPEERRALHARVSRWFADNGRLEEALEHAVAADDPAGAERLLSERLEGVLDGDDWSRLDGILGLFPPEARDHAPGLLLLRAWAAFRRGRLREAEAAVQRVEAPPRPGASSVPHEAYLGAVHALRSSLQYARGNFEDAVAHAHDALRGLPDERYFHRGIAVTNLVGALWLSGRTDEANDLAESVLADVTERGAGVRGRLLALLSFLRWRDGDLTGLMAVADRCEEHARESNLPRALAVARLYRGLASYQRGDLPSAEADLEGAHGSAHFLTPEAVLELAHARALLYRGQGRHEEARRIVELEASTGAPTWASEGIRADLALKQGDLEGALEVAERWVRLAPVSVDVPFHPVLAYGKALVFDQGPHSDRPLGPVLDRLGKARGGRPSLRLRIELLCLEALLLRKEGDEGAALERIAEALALAEPGPHLRLFVDFGPALADYLRMLARTGPHRNLVRDILSAYYEDRLSSGGWHGERSSPARASGGVDASSLTQTELEILGLLAQGLLYREIAERRFVSVETVKTHLKHVYRKLDVENRRQAVARARSMGVFEQAGWRPGLEATAASA